MITAATLIKRNDACREGSRIYKTKGGDKDASLPPSLSLSHIIFTFLSPFLLPSFSGLTLLLLYLFIVHTHTYCPVNICTVGDAATRSVFIVNMSVCVCVCVFLHAKCARSGSFKQDSRTCLLLPLHLSLTSSFIHECEHTHTHLHMLVHTHSGCLAARRIDCWQIKERVPELLLNSLSA